MQGHFSVNAIRMAFICVAYPALVLTYFGQAAWLTQNQDAVSSTFCEGPVPAGCCLLTLPTKG